MYSRAPVDFLSGFGGGPLTKGLGGPPPRSGGFMVRSKVWSFKEIPREAKAARFSEGAFLGPRVF